jgi:hypothetical protein
VPDDETKSRIAKYRGNKITGTFRVCLDEGGGVESVLPMHSTGFPAYDHELLAKMALWRYSPYTIDGNPVPVCTTIRSSTQNADSGLLRARDARSPSSRQSSPEEDSSAGEPWPTTLVLRYLRKAMLLVGLEHLFALVEGTAFEGKVVINERGAVFGPVFTQHRDLKAQGISYADDYKGNALAAMLAPGKIEVRFHKDLTDEEVARLIRALSSEPRLSFLRQWRATYQGRRLDIGSEQ